MAGGFNFTPAGPDARSAEFDVSELGDNGQGPRKEHEGVVDRQHRAWWRRASRVALLLAALMSILLLGAALALSAYLTDERLREIAVGTVNDALRGTFEIESLEVSVLEGYIEARGVSVFDPAEGKRVLSIRRVAVGLDPWRLLRNEVRILSAELEGLMVRMVPPDGVSPEDPDEPAFTLLEAFEPTGTPGEGDPWFVKAGGLSVEDLTLVVATADGLDVGIAGGELDGGTFSWGESGLEAGFQGFLEQLSVKLDGSAYELRDVRAEGVTFVMDVDSAGRVDIEAINALIAGPDLVEQGRIQVSGSVSGFGHQTDDAALALDIEVAGELDVAAAVVREMLPEDLASSLGLEGTVAATLRIGGSSFAPRITGELSSTDLEALGESFEEVSAGFSWVDEKLVLDDVVLALTGGGSLEGSISLDLSDSQSPGWELRSRAKQLPLNRLFEAMHVAMEGEAAEPMPIPDRVDGSISGSGSGFESPEGRFILDVHLTGMSRHLPPGLPDGWRLTGAVGVGHDSLRLSSLRLAGGGVEATLDGNVPVNGGSLDLGLRVLHQRPADVLSPYDLPVKVGAVELYATVTGKLDSPKAEGELRIERAEVLDLPRASVLAPFRLDGGVVHLDAARVGIAGGELTVSGAIRALGDDLAPAEDPTMSFDLRGADLNLEQLSAGKAAGTLTVHGKVDGSLSSPSGRGRLDVEGLVVEEIEFSRVSANVTSDGNEVLLRHFYMVPAAGGRLHGDGGFRLSDGHVDARVSAEAMPLALAGVMLDEALPVGGFVDVSAVIGGPADELTVSARLDTKGLAYDDVPLGDLAAEISGGMQEITLDAKLVSEAGTLTLGGRVSLEDGDLDLDLGGERLRVEDMPFLVDSDLNVAGRVLVELSLGGKLGSPMISGRVLARTLELDGGRLGDGRIDLHIEPAGRDAHAIEADILGAGRMHADLRLEPSLSLVASAELDSFSLASILPGLAEDSLDAVLSGLLELRYGMDPHELAMDLRLGDLQVILGDEVLSSDGPVRISWDGETVLVDGLVLHGPRGMFEASGEIGEAIIFYARGSLEMELLAPFLADVALASGTLEVDLTVEGTADDPEIRGYLGIARPVRLRPRRVIREIEIAEGLIRFEPGKVSMERLSGRVHGGMFRASGEVHLDGLDLAEYELTFRGQNLPFRTNELLLEANADLSVSGHGTNANVSGRIDVVRGRYLQKFELDRFVFRPARRVTGDPLAQQAPFLSDIDLSVQVTSLGAMEIRADAGAFALDMVLDADLKVTGTAADPVLAGRVEASRGGLEFPRASLDVARSIIDFVPKTGAGISPRVDLRAEGEISPPTGGEGGETTYFVTLVLEGDLEEMLLDLTSDPALDRLEILSLLVTGRRPGDHIGGEEGRHAEAAMAFAGAQLAEPLTRFLTQQLESHLNLDLDLSAEVTSAGLLLIAGTEITRRLRFEWAFQRGFGDAEASSAARARYLISDKVFLEGTTESAMGGASTSGSAGDGARTHLELKLRLYGD